MSGRALFAVAPYLAALSLLAGLLLRDRLAHRHGRLGPDRLRTALALFGGGRAWRVGLAGTGAGHVLLLAAPRRVLAWNQDPARLLALEAALFLCGAAALAGLCGLLRRHFRDPELREAASPADAAVLGLLLASMLSGAGVALLYRWASSWSAVTLAPYAQSVLRLRPGLQLMEALPYLVQLHVATAIAAAALLPLSHLADLLLVPLHQGASVLFAPAAALLRWSARLELRARRGAQSLLWSEDED